MSCLWRVSVIAFLLLSLIAIGMAQDARLTDWLAVPSGRAGIVLTIDFPVSEAKISSGGQVLASKKWIPKVPLVWQLRVSPDTYQIHFEQGPISSIGVIAKQPRSLTYVGLTPVRQAGGIIGVSATVTTGSAPAKLAEQLETAAGIGISDAFTADFIDGGNKMLLVSTEPPWHSAATT